MNPIGQHIIDSITLGSSYALLGISIALIFGIMRLINFAQGELIMVGAYGATIVEKSSWPVILLVMIVTPVIFALAMERIAFRPVRETTDATLLVTSFAVSYLLQNLAMLFFTATPRSINLTPNLDLSFRFDGIVVPRFDIALVLATVVLLVGLSLFLGRTRLGIYLRAASEDFTTARIMGVKANRIIAVAFAISGLMCGVSAFFQVVQTGEVYPTMGENALLVAFIATALGGLGSVLGAVIGGYILGTLTIFLSAYLPANLDVYTNVFAYLLVIVVLTTRPQGIFVPKTARTRV